MYKLDFYLDVYNGNHSNWLTEFTEEKPVHYFSDGIRYVYIPEPINMKKKSFYLKDESGENYYSFDCDFSKAGWYKIIESVYSFNENPLYTSIKNIKLYLYDWP